MGSSVANTPALWRNAVPHPAADAHKFQRGYLVVASGTEFNTGAARLAARAGLHAGAGLVALVGDPAALRVHAAHLSAIMLRPAADADAFRAAVGAPGVSALVIGPNNGVTDWTRERLTLALESDKPLVIDADALTVLGRMDALPDLGRAVLTPHEGEFTRVFPALQDLGREQRAAAAAARSGAIVVLKGRATVIAAPDGQLVIDTRGGVQLATAGSGDVLSGIVGSHLAQGMAAFEAACAGVWLHGVVAERFNIGMTADDLADAVRPLLVQLGDGRAVH